MEARVVWDHEGAGSTPADSTENNQTVVEGWCPRPADIQAASSSILEATTWETGRYPNFHADTLSRLKPTIIVNQMRSSMLLRTQQRLKHGHATCFVQEVVVSMASTADF